MTEKRNHHTVAITREAYDLVTEKAERLHTDRKAITSEAVLYLFQERRLPYLFAVAFIATGIAIGLSVGVFL